VPDFKFPGVYVEEIDPGMHPIEGVSTTIAAFVGFAESGTTTATLISSFNEYNETFGGFATNGYLPYAVQGFFQNGGQRCYVLRLSTHTSPLTRAKLPSLPRSSVKEVGVPADPKLTHAMPIEAAKALVQLDTVSDISIVCCPDEHSVSGMTAALIAQCERLRYRFAVLAAPVGDDLSNAPPSEARSAHAAYYASWVMVANPAGGAAIAVHPGGHITGAIVANDLRRGVHKAPGNLPITGIVGLERIITDRQQEALSPRGVNVLRNFPGRGNFIWGTRTTSSDPEWKYVNIRRFFIYLENSIEQGTQWVAFEPNGEPLWASVRQTIDNFLLNVWKVGALLGNSPGEAYFVRCDRTTMTQDDIDNGRLICLVGVAAVRPAEFVIFRIGQRTADASC
jgi:phage tail sheath protein FI